MKPRKSDSKPREQAPEGNHTARLLGITDLGHQPGFIWMGKDIPSAWKYELTYELVNTEMEDGRPFVISEEIKQNFSENPKTKKRSNLMARARSLMGQDYMKVESDVSVMLGQPCSVTVEHNENGYAQIKGQAAVGSLAVELMRIGVKELQNTSYVFDMNDPDMDLWESFSDFRKGKIRSALNFDETVLARTLAESDEY